MKYKVLVSCTGIGFSYSRGETVEIADEKLATDLLNAGFIVSAEPQKKEAEAETVKTKKTTKKK